MNIWISCSANEVRDVYVQAARRLAALLVEAGHTIVYGGVDLGLMKIIADETQLHGGKLIGVSMEHIQQFNRPVIAEIINAKDLAERKAILLQRCDAIIVLVGGVGTLDEATEMIEHRGRNRHQKPIIIVNTDGYYNGLKAQLMRMEREGFLPAAEFGDRAGSALERLVRFVATPHAAVAALARE
jgi:hypothetical protein